MKKIINAWFDFIGWVNKTMGREFVRIHTIIFTVLIIDVIVSAIPSLGTGITKLSFFFQYLILLLKLWVWIGGGFTLIWIILRITNLDLWVYYFICIPILAETDFGKFYFRFFYGKRADRIIPRIKDVQASKRLHAEGYETSDGSIKIRYPSFIKREHLERKNFWPHWVFSIVTIFDQRSLHTNVEKINGIKTWTLEVDLRDESFGIYSNRGKRFLSSRFKSVIDDYKELSQQTQDLFMPEAPFGVTPVIQGATLPLRWASGGFLSVVYYKEKYWVPLFFRDISPIGLNVANGATENKEEYKSLNRLISREFSEEMILLTSKPSTELEMTQVLFEVVLPSKEGSTYQEYRAGDFVGTHAKLRQMHDRFCIYIPEDDEKNTEKRRLHPLNTPFIVEVKYHLPDLHRDKTNRVEFVVPSINPRETGIETIWLCTFEMKKGEYLIDGEYDLARNYLIRQPVILLDLDFLEGIFSKTGGLGELVVNQEGFDDVKRLPNIPGDHFKLFDADVEFRKMRLKHLEQLSAEGGINKIRSEYELSGKKSLDALR